LLDVHTLDESLTGLMLYYSEGKANIAMWA
jgi:hypothetical protein